ncbi:hypothetical protein BJ944DRAFT_238273 [Cunninghamella echinulata]|nr:hypothetical protein BJ944DRAFT_238273 [Cunninghamella echinulata]
MENNPSTAAQFGAFYQHKLHHPTGEHFPSILLLVVPLLQTIATIILVGLFHIPYDVKLMSFCIISFTQMGFGQYNLIQLEFSLCYVNDQNNIPLTNNSNRYMVLPYGIVGTSCIGFLLLLIISIYYRKYFQLSMDSLHSTLTSLLKLDAFLVFTYTIGIMPIPIITHSSSSIALTEQTLPGWYAFLHMILLSTFCMAFIGYLCYRLIGFTLETNSFILRIRYSLFFACLAPIVILLLTTSLALKSTACQWKLRHLQPHQQQRDIEQHQIENKQLLQKEQTINLDQNDSDDNELFLTPQVSRII